MFKKQVQTRSNLFQDALSRIGNFTVSQWICGSNGNTALAIDERRLLVCLLTLIGKDQASARVIPAVQMLSAEIITDQASKSNVLLNQVSGAVIGGALFGDAGAIVGANSGVIMASGIKKIVLQLTIDDISNPFHHVLFYPDISKWADKKEQAMKEAQRWQVLLAILAKRAAESGQPAIPPPLPPNRLPQPALDAPEPPRQPNPAPRPAPGPRCTLRPAAGTFLPPVHVSTEIFTIGRGGENNLVLQDPAVSRQHAVLRFANGAWFIQDRGSRAGLLVNGQRVQAARLTSGCQIGIGAQTFIFTAE